jgi:hypothetical protein
MFIYVYIKCLPKKTRLLYSRKALNLTDIQIIHATLRSQISVLLQKPSLKIPNISYKLRFFSVLPERIKYEYPWDFSYNTRECRKCGSSGSIADYFCKLIKLL